MKIENYNTTNFKRIGDNLYSFDINIEKPNCKSKLKINIESKLKKEKPVSHELIKSISNTFNKKNVTDLNIFYFNYKNKIYKINPSGKPLLINIFLRFIRAIGFSTHFLKNHKNLYLQSYTLEEVGFLSTLYLKLSFWLKKQVISDLNFPEFSSEQTEPSLENTTKEPCFFSDFIKIDSFSDPYSALATLAFQKYETFYDAHDSIDGQKFDENNAIIEKSGKLVLVKKYQVQAEPKELQKQTLENYHQFLKQTYGAEKIAYIEKCYGIDLTQMKENFEALTPEIIYRMNIGVGNLENQDIQNLYSKLKKLKNLVNESLEAGKALETTESNSFFSFFKAHQHHLDLSLFEIKGLYRALDNKNPNLDDLNILLSQWDFSVSCDKLNTSSFNALVNLLSVRPDEREKQYTGRKIHFPITSAYTTGDWTLFKPWLDQQELLQTFDDLSAYGWDHYYEKLSHIICKKHLVWQHPTDLYRVGALIPAPRASNGQSQWYKVTSFVNNGRGIVSYTLEPACTLFSLPAIKLYRSTSSCHYAMDGLISVANDFNPLNPPGYEGAYLSEKYEIDFFKRYTIPSWVAYQHQANQKIQALEKSGEDASQSLEKIHADLSQSTKEFQQEEIRQNKPLSFSQIIKKYDAEFIDLLTVAANSKEISQTSFLRLLVKYLINGLSSLFFSYFISVKNIEKLFQSEYSDLQNMLYNASLKTSTLEKDLDDDLEKLLFIKKILNKLPSSKLKDELSIVINDQYDKAEQYKKGQSLVKSPPSQLQANIFNIQNLYNKAEKNEEKLLLLKEWNDLLLEHAKALKEDVGSKQSQDLSFAGHSLGGASAQQALVSIMIYQNRMPLPNQKIHLYTFDEPAIRGEDNQAFKDYGNQHVELLQAQHSHFKITRRQEEGDSIPIAGEEHLGAASSKKEEDDILRWLSFDACVQSSVLDVQDPTIAASQIAHGTQFELGKRQATWIKEMSQKAIEAANMDNEKLSKISKIYEKAQGDYYRTWYSPTIQGIFDKGSNSHQWASIENLWRLDMDGAKAEYRRKMFGLIFRIFLAIKSLQVKTHNSPLHGDWWTLCDKQGVFAVNETGVLTHH